MQEGKGRRVCSISGVGIVSHPKDPFYFYKKLEFWTEGVFLDLGKLAFLTN